MSGQIIKIDNDDYQDVSKMENGDFFSKKIFDLYVLGKPIDEIVEQIEFEEGIFIPEEKVVGSIAKTKRELKKDFSSGTYLKKFVFNHLDRYDYLYNLFTKHGISKLAMDCLKQKESLIQVSNTTFKNLFEKGDVFNKDEHYDYDWDAIKENDPDTYQLIIDNFPLNFENKAEVSEWSTQLRKEVYRDSYYEFYKDAFAQIEPGTIYIDNWHVEYLCNLLQEELYRVKVYKKPKEKDIIINMPFRASKSLICSISFPAWGWTIDASTKYLCTSYSDDIINDHAGKFQNLIRSAWYVYYFSDVVKITSDAKTKITTSETGIRDGTSISGSLTGKGFDIQIADDVQSGKTILSKADREKANELVSGILPTRFNDMSVGVLIVVMQRLHSSDAPSFLMGKNKSGYSHINIPAFLDSVDDKKSLSPPDLIKFYDNGMFWKSRFTRKLILNFFTNTLTPNEASSQLQQRPVSLEGNIVKGDYIRIVTKEQVGFNPLRDTVHFLIDGAYTADTKNDPSGILACFVRDGILYVIKGQLVWLELHELISFLKGFIRDAGGTTRSKIYIEPRANGHSIMQELKRTSQMKVLPISGKFVQKDKEQNLNSIVPQLESGNILIQEGDWNEEFLSQITEFPFAKHDEYVDLLSYASLTLLSKKDLKIHFI